MGWSRSRVYRLQNCCHFLGHKKKNAREMLLFSHVGVPAQIILSPTANREKHAGEEASTEKEHTRPKE